MQQNSSAAGAQRNSDGVEESLPHKRLSRDGFLAPLGVEMTKLKVQLDLSHYSTEMTVTDFGSSLTVSLPPP